MLEKGLLNSNRCAAYSEYLNHAKEKAKFLPCHRDRPRPSVIVISGFLQLKMRNKYRTVNLIFEVYRRHIWKQDEITLFERGEASSTSIWFDSISSSGYDAHTRNKISTVSASLIHLIVHERYSDY